MPRGGARPGAGRPRKKSKPEAPKEQASDGEMSVPPSPTDEPLDYMLKVMRDPNSNADLRARMAVAAAPYMHAKMGEQGKKEQKNEAAKKLASRFGASAPPPRSLGKTAH